MKSYSFKEYKLISENDYTLIEKFLNNLKINKKEYKKIIILITIFMNKNLISYCMTTETEISNVATQILSLLMVFAKLKIAKRTNIWGMQIYDDEKTNIKR